MKDFQIQTYALEIKHGNRLAFSDFFRKNHDQFVRYSIKFVKDKDDAMDIVQDVFIKLWNGRDNIDTEKSFLSYIYTAVRNHSLNFLRDHSNKLESLPDIEIPDENEQPSHNDSLIQSLKIYIQNLPVRQREAFELSRFEGMQHDEIAEIMNVSARTVNNHIVSALKTLRDKLTSTHRIVANE